MNIIGEQELLILLIMAMLLYGSVHLPTLMRDLGRRASEYQLGMQDDLTIQRRRRMLADAPKRTTVESKNLCKGEWVVALTATYMTVACGMASLSECLFYAYAVILIIVLLFWFDT